MHKWSLLVELSIRTHQIEASGTSKLALEGEP